ncbi:hypothetical protein [Enterobacter asburiae]|uniref:hypothetical protein n=1 Tax=Enterobacter asburiae TaxID=61645 RepID=UPI00387DC235
MGAKCENAKSHVLAAIALVRHTLTLFGGIVPRKASAHLRDLLTQTETLMLSDVSAQTAISTARKPRRQTGADRVPGDARLRAFLDAKAETKSRKTLSVSRIFIFPVMPPS